MFESFRIHIPSDVPDYLFHPAIELGLVNRKEEDADIWLIEAQTFDPSTLRTASRGKYPILLDAVWLGESIAEGRVLDAKDGWSSCRIDPIGLKLPAPLPTIRDFKESDIFQGLVICVDPSSYKSDLLESELIAHHASITSSPLDATHLVLDDDATPPPPDSLIRRPKDPLLYDRMRQLSLTGSVVNLGWPKRAFSTGRTETDGFEARLQWDETFVEENHLMEEVVEEVAQHHAQTGQEEDEQVPKEQAAVQSVRSTSPSQSPPRLPPQLPPVPKVQPNLPLSAPSNKPKRKRPSWYYEEIIDDPLPPPPPPSDSASLSPPPPEEPEGSAPEGDGQEKALPRNKGHNGKKPWTNVERAYLVESVATTTCPRDAFIMFRRRYPRRSDKSTNTHYYVSLGGRLIWDKLVEAFKEGKTDLSQVDYHSPKPWLQARHPAPGSPNDRSSTSAQSDLIALTPSSSISDPPSLDAHDSSLDVDPSPSEYHEQSSGSKGMPEKERRKSVLSNPRASLEDRDAKPQIGSPSCSPRKTRSRSRSRPAQSPSFSTAQDENQWSTSLPAAPSSTRAVVQTAVNLAPSRHYQYEDPSPSQALPMGSSDPSLIQPELPAPSRPSHSLNRHSSRRSEPYRAPETFNSQDFVIPPPLCFDSPVQLQEESAAPIANSYANSIDEAAAMAWSSMSSSAISPYPHPSTLLSPRLATPSPLNFPSAQPESHQQPLHSILQQPQPSTLPHTHSHSRSSLPSRLSGQLVSQRTTQRHASSSSTLQLNARTASSAAWTPPAIQTASTFKSSKRRSNSPHPAPISRSIESTPPPIPILASESTWSLADSQLFSQSYPFAETLHSNSSYPPPLPLKIFSSSTPPALDLPPSQLIASFDDFLPIPSRMGRWIPSPP